MPSQRKQDENGFLLVKGCPISSFGIFDYSAGQLGLPGDPNRIVKVFRPESAVSDLSAIESFKDVPLINDHEMLSGLQNDETATAPEEYGVSGVLTANVYYEAPWMRGDIKVFSRDMQAALASGKKDLSLGYSCDFELTPGVWNGQPYEVVQTNMRGNHIALVDEGRVPGAKVLDGLIFDHLNFAVRPSDKRNDNMTIKATKGKANPNRKVVLDNAVAQLQALLPALQEFLGEEAKEPEHQGGEAGAAAGNTAATDDPLAGEAAAGAEGVAAPAGTEAVAAPENTAGEAGELPQLIAQVEGVLAQIKALCAGSAGDEGMNGTTNETQGVNGTVDEGAANAAGESQAEAQNAADAEAGSAGEGQGKASAGPAAGINAQAKDSAVSAFYADLAVKDSVYNRLSSVVGAFDCKTMDARQVSAYGVKKLGLKCADGMEVVTLDAYLTGIAVGRKQQTQVVKAAAADSASANSEMDAYLKGAK